MLTKIITALDGVTETTTSSAIPIKYAKKVTFLFTRADHTSGSSTFTLTGSVDGTTYVDLNKIITNVTNTNSQNKVRASSVALAADGSEIASLDLQHDALTHIKVKVTEATDGTHTAKVYVEYED